MPPPHISNHTKITPKQKKLLNEAKDGRYFLYRKGDITGFGNKLRGIHIAFHYCPVITSMNVTCYEHTYSDFGLALANSLKNSAISLDYRLVLTFEKV